MSELPAYVAALERQNRLLRRLTAVCLALLLVVVVCGAHVITDSLVIEESLTVKDLNGTNRFELVVNPGTGLSNGFHIVDANGQTRIDMGVTDKGKAVIAFLDGNGQVLRTLP